MTPKTPTWMNPKKYVAAVMDRMAGNFFITGPCTIDIVNTAFRSG
jgi:hypothetical protein